MLAYTVAATQSAIADELWLDSPGDAPTQLAGVSVTGGFAWSPDGRTIAVGTGQRLVPGGFSGALEVVSASGGATTTWYQAGDNVVEPAGWWPDGRGLLFWLDIQGSASLAADGLALDSQSAGGQPVQLATTLVNP